MLLAIMAEGRPGGPEHRPAVRPTHFESPGDGLLVAGPFPDAWGIDNPAGR